MEEKKQEEVNERSFLNIAEIHRYLKKQGWKISKTQLYKHAEIEKFQNKDGKYLISSIDKYALKYLKTRDGSRPGKNLADIQKRRYAAELRETEAAASLKETKLRILEGQYVPRDAFERALAQRAMIFKNDIETFIRREAPEITRLAGGHADKVPDLIEFMLDKSTEWLNRYAQDKEFTVPEKQFVLNEDKNDDQVGGAQLIDDDSDDNDD